MKAILWLDNDYGNIAASVSSLREGGFDVEVAASASEAEQMLLGRRFDLVIIDVMIPTLDEGEEEVYSPDLTDDSLSTGLHFFRRNAAALRAAGSKIFVFTVRPDEEIKERFFAEGLAADEFARKAELRNVPAFVDTIRRSID